MEIPRAGNDDTIRIRTTRDALYQSALDLEKSGDLKGALEKYKMALQTDNNHFDSWLNAGAVYSRLGKSEKAIRCFQQAAILEDDARAWYNLGTEYFRAKRYKEARESCHKAIRADKKFLKAHLLLGYVYGKLEENDKAELAIRNALRIEPDNPAALTALALLYFHAGRDRDASIVVKLLLKKNPEDTTAVRLRSGLELRSGDTSASIRSLRKIAGKDSKLRDIRDSVRDSGLESVIRSKASTILAKEKRTKQDWFSLSLMQLLAGDEDKALANLARLSEAARKHSEGKKQ